MTDHRSSRYHSFYDQVPRNSSYSVEVGGLGRVHFPRPSSTSDQLLPQEDEGDDASSVDENYDIQSITSSIEDQLR